MADNYVAGETVEFFRRPNTKDVSGWHGPAMIIYVKDGQVFIQWQGSVLICQRQDVRRAILSWCIYNMSVHHPPAEDLRIEKVINYVGHMQNMSTQILRMFKDTDEWRITKLASSNYQISTCLLYSASCDLRLERCLGAHLAHGMPKLPQMKEQTLMV